MSDDTIVMKFNMESLVSLESNFEVQNLLKLKESDHEELESSY